MIKEVWIFLFPFSRKASAEQDVWAVIILKEADEVYDRFSNQFTVQHATHLLGNGADPAGPSIPNQLLILEHFYFCMSTLYPNNNILKGEVSCRSQSSSSLLRSRGNVKIPLIKVRLRWPHAVQPQPEAGIVNVDFSDTSVKHLGMFEMFFVSSVTLVLSARYMHTAR